MDHITLNDLVFHAYHGVYEFEKKDGNDFCVDLKIGADLKIAETSDDLEDTVDYERIYHAVASCMEERSNLLEHVAGRITKVIFRDFPQVRSLNVRIAKLNPPIRGKVGSTAVELERHRQDYEPSV